MAWFRVPLVAWGLAAFAILGAVYGVGRFHGAGAEAERYRVEAAKLQARLDRYVDRAAVEAERLRALEAEAARRGRELEDDAHSDVGAGDPALGADSVRRLFSR